MDRRVFLTTGTASAVVAGLARPLRVFGGAASPGVATWRAFEVTTRAEIVNPTGVTRVWLPLPLMPDTDYHKNQGQSWTGNATATRIHREPKYGAAIFYAEWPASEPSPVVEVTTRFATRDRAVRSTAPGRIGREDRRELAKYLEATRLIRTDGIVRRTAVEITKGAKTELDKARAAYEWTVENTFRDPKVRGCGIGDISRAQHCRAEFYLPTHGWVPVDPADVRKVVLEEQGGLALGDATVQRARAKLFGAWEMNYLAYNYAHDVRLPDASGDPIAFFMYPQAESGGEPRDSLDPGAFRYNLTSRELRM